MPPSIKANAFHFIFLVLIFVQSFFFKEVAIKKDLNITIFKNSSSSNNLASIGIGIVSTPPTHRISQLFKEWGNKFMELSSPDSIFVASEDCKDFKGFPCHPISEHYMKFLQSHKYSGRYADFNRAVKRVTLLEELIKNPSVNWMVVFTDDVMMDLNKLAKVLSDWNAMGNPENVSIVKGHCIDESYTYVQGGSGSVFSRKAAELLLQHKEEWVSNLNNFDDVYFSKWTKMIGIEPRQMSSGYFIGHDILWHDQNAVKERNWVTLAMCPKRAATTYCDSDLYPINKVAVWHQSTQDKAKEMRLAASGDDIPDSICVYTVRSTPHICQIR